MKKFAILFAGLFLMTFAFQSVNAQNPPTASASASAAAFIITPLTITKSADMSFGNIIASGTIGTVILDNANVRSATGGVSFSNVAGTITSAEFGLVGFSGANYSVTLPADDVITLLNGTAEMKLKSFTSNATGILSTGVETFKVGATLQVGIDQDAGAYSASFPVIVNYN